MLLNIIFFPWWWEKSLIPDGRKRNLTLCIFNGFHRISAFRYSTSLKPSTILCFKNNLYTSSTKFLELYCQCFLRVLFLLHHRVFVFQIMLVEWIVTVKAWKKFQNRIQWCSFQHFRFCSILCYFTYQEQFNISKTTLWKADEIVSKSKIVLREDVGNTGRETWQPGDLEKHIKTWSFGTRKVDRSVELKEADIVPPHNKFKAI